ncbi:MAG: translin family protein [Candidatus Lokiarchaeota archaeon]|nr:translin family protein [Candidatus Lokiarchaeota archaeon]
MDLKNIFSRITSNLDEIDQNREEILKLSRQMIRDCSVAIKSIHRKEFTSYGEIIKEIRDKHQQLLLLVEKNPTFFSNYLKTPEQEYVEALSLYSIIQKEEIPGPGDCNVSEVNYLLGLADTIGELRRNVLDKIRIGEVQNIEEILNVMEDIYSYLFALDYPKGITQDLRRKTDIARSLIEKTRGDISLTIQMNRFKESIK